MTDTPILDEQAAGRLPMPAGMAEGTNLILPPRTVEQRIAHLPPEVYDLQPTSHLYHFLAALLGDAGVGQLRKRMLMSRIETTLQGTHFYDLDRFYGALLGIHRRVNERLNTDPTTAALTHQQWDSLHQRDASYRSRIEQFAKAIQFGASAIGMELIAEALLSVDCDIYESFMQADKDRLTYADLEAFTYDELQAFTYDELEGNVYNENPDFNRWTFTVVPKRPITPEERIDLIRVLRVFKPAQALLRVQDLTQSAFEPVTLRSAAATSEHWEVHGRVTAREGRESGYVDIGTVFDPAEQPRPPFSSYQGERWSHMGDIAGITGYAEEGDQLVDSTLADTERFADGTVVRYAPDRGIRLIQDTLAARAVSDGILVAHPISRVLRTHGATQEVIDALLRRIPREQLLNSIRADQTTQVYVDGLRLRDLTDTASSTTTVLRRQRASNDQRFWATPPQPATSIRRESMEVRFRAPVVVNRITFKVSHFPHRLWVQYFDRGTSTWVDVYSTIVTDSMPARITARDEAQRARLHPHHSLNGHWLPVEVRTDPIEASSFRIQMQRYATGGVPVDRYGQPIDYSLAAKDLDIGYAIEQRSDIPVAAVTGNEVGNTLDLLGSRVSFSLREHAALNAIDGDPNVAWVSEPQPIGSAVVAFYLDARDSQGAGQIIDHFYLDPVKPGPLLNLYYSDQEQIGHFKAADRPLTFGETWATGNYESTELGMAFDSADPSYFTVDNAYLQLDPSKDWSWGIHLQPRYIAALANHAPLFAFGNYFAEVHAGEVIFTTTFGDTVAAPVDFGADTNVKVVVSYEARTQMISIDVAWGEARSAVEHSVTQTTVAPVSTVTIGGNPAGDGVNNMILLGAVLKQGEIIDPEDFFGATTSYLLKATYSQHDDGRTDNALLRFHRSFVSTESPLGLVGGSGNFYNDLAWTPVPRDFTLQKGYISLPPIKARFWKFEFSNLVIEPYEVFVPMQRVIKTFPASAMPRSVPFREDPSADLPGYQAAAAGRQTYVDTPRWDTTTFDTEAVLPTSALYAAEATGTQRLREQAWSYGFVPWHIGSSNPRFQERGVHRYNEIHFEHTEKVAFFVGIKEIQAYQTNYGANDNPEAIIERYWNAAMLTPGSSFTLNPGDLATGARTFAEAESTIFQSRNSVSAIQFATQQTDAIQLIPDDEFRDPRLSLNEWSNDDSWHVVGDASLSYIQADHAVRMTRYSDPLEGVDPYADGIVTEPVHPVMATYSEDSAGPADEGGIESGLVRVSPEGAVHAAGRITALTDLTTPVWVQIVDINGTVLAEESVRAKAGDTVEWTASYILGSYNATYEPRFENRGIIDDPVHPVLAGEDPLADLGPGPASPGHLFRVRLVQKQGSDDSLKIDRLSLFDESIVWEFSVDGGTTYIPAHGVRNNPNALVTMPRAGTHLRYRVRAYRRNLHISALQIRPRYVDIPTLRLAMTYRGPNVSAFDQYPPIQDDPEFKRWKHPVPRWWWLEGQRYGSLPIDGYTYTNEFSRGFIRHSETILPEITDTATRSVNLYRHGVGNIPGGESLPVTDDATRSVSLYRAVATDISDFEPDEAWANKMSDDRMPHPPIHPTPTAEEPYIDGDFDAPGSDEDWGA